MCIFAKIDRRIIMLIRRNSEVVGMKDFEHDGSNVEKMSGIMQDSDGVYWRL